jgi:hypothetical protein
VLLLDCIYLSANYRRYFPNVIADHSEIKAQPPAAGRTIRTGAHGVDAYGAMLCVDDKAREAWPRILAPLRISRAKAL